MENRDQKEFTLAYIEKELDRLDGSFDDPLKIYVAGGYVMSSNGLKAGTKDIDVIVETRSQLASLSNALEKAGYRLLPINSAMKGYRDLSAVIYENDEGFRWDIFARVVADKLALTKSMKSRAKLTQSKAKLSLFELSKEDIFLMKGVTDRDRDLDDMALIARTGVNYKTVFEECLTQSNRTGKLWEMGLYDKCVELEEKYSVRVPIARKLRKVAEEKMLVKRIVAVLQNGNRTREELATLLKGKLKNSDVEAGLKILSKQGRIRVSKNGKILLIP